MFSCVFACDVKNVVGVLFVIYSAMSYGLSLCVVCVFACIVVAFCYVIVCFACDCLCDVVWLMCCFVMCCVFNLLDFV